MISALTSSAPPRPRRPVARPPAIAEPAAPSAPAPSAPATIGPAQNAKAETAMSDTRPKICLARHHEMPDYGGSAAAAPEAPGVHLRLDALGDQRKGYVLASRAELFCLTSPKLVIGSHG